MGMNLIEKLGLEKCKQIVDGAFKRAVVYNTKCDEYFDVACACCVDDEVNLSDLRTALADHDRIDTCTDIRNHISPNTKVIEHESNKNTV